MDTEEYMVLVYKNLKGLATPVEFQHLNSLSAKDAKLAQLRLDIEDAWDLSGEIPTVVSKEDTQKLLKKIIESTAKKTEVKSKGKIITLKSLISSIAAVFVLLIGSFWLLKDKAESYNKAGEYILADNSKITLREGSSLNVLPFDNSQRRVELKGEAYFEIAKDASRPFVVASQHSKISVLGTSFLVKEKNDETFIDLIEGKISVLDSRTLDTEIMTAGMKVKLNAKGKIIPLNNYKNLSSWKNGIIEYENIKLSTVLEELALIFNTSIELNNESLEDCIFSAILSDNNVNDILNRITKKFDLTLSQEKTKWILTGGQCK